MGAPTLRCSPMDGDEVLPAAIDEDSNVGNVTCLPTMGNAVGMWYLVAMATCVMCHALVYCLRMILIYYTDVYCILYILNVNAIND